MKTQLIFTAKLCSALLLLLTGSYLLAQDSSAVLDLEATEKGILIPRTDTATVNAAVSPATGLLIFQTGDASFYYHNGIRWVRLQTGYAGMLSDADGDTKVQVEESPDEDVIRFDVDSVEAMSLMKGSGGVPRLQWNGRNVLVGDSAGIALDDGEHNIFLGRKAGLHTVTGYENFFAGHEAGMQNTSGFGNTFIGQNAGKNNLIGLNNTYIGPFSGYSSTESARNVFIGFATGREHLSGSDNVFIGRGAGYSDTTGIRNIFIGRNAGYYNYNGTDNVFLGRRSGYRNGSGMYNVMIGYEAGYNNEQDHNLMMGYWAGYNNTTGNGNIFLGKEAGYANTVSSSNIFIGQRAGFSNETGDRNIFLGASSGRSNKQGSDNIFIGTGAGQFDTLGNHNVFLGTLAGLANYDGSDNILLGRSSGYNNNGNENIMLGLEAGYFSNGNKNILIGNKAGRFLGGGEENIMLGELAGYSNMNGNQNVVIGRGAGYLNPAGENNIFIGSSAGSSNNITNNTICIGTLAGAFNDNSQRLFIETSGADSTGALIYGEFDNDILRVNGALGIGTQPVQELDVKGDIALSNGFGSLQFRNPGGVKADLMYDGSTLLLRNFYNAGDVLVESEDDIQFQPGGGSTTLFLEETGDVGVGTTAPEAQLDVRANSGSSYPQLRLDESGTTDFARLRMRNGTGNAYWDLSGRSSGGAHEFHLYYHNGSSGENKFSFHPSVDNFEFDGDIIPYNVSWDLGNNNGSEHWDEVVAVDHIMFSDRRLKEDIRPLDAVIPHLMQLSAVNYIYKDVVTPDKRRRPGFLAQEVQELFPSLVIEEDVDIDKDGNIKKEKNEYLGMNYMEFVPLAIKAIQEQQEQIESQEARIAELERAVQELLAR